MCGERFVTRFHEVPGGEAFRSLHAADEVGAVLNQLTKAGLAQSSRVPQSAQFGTEPSLCGPGWVDLSRLEWHPVSRKRKRRSDLIGASLYRHGGLITVLCDPRAVRILVWDARGTRTPSQPAISPSNTAASTVAGARSGSDSSTAAMI